MGEHPGAFLLLIGFFLLAGRNSGQRLKTEKLGRTREDQAELDCPKTRTGSPVSALWPTHASPGYSFFNGSAQLLLCGSISGRSSETARMQDWPSN